MRWEEEMDIVEVAEGPSVPARPERGAERHAAAVQREAAYGIKIWIDRPYDEAMAAARAALADEGFDVISEIDLRKTFVEKLGVDFPHYTILGAANLQWARQALQLDVDLGLLLPFNLVVYEETGGAVVEAVDSIAHLAIADGADLDDLARAVKQKLQDVIDRVAVESRR